MRRKNTRSDRAEQADLVTMARWVAATGQRLCILFEGRDTAGKAALSGDRDKLNPRQCRVVALTKPTETSRPMYFQRFVSNCLQKAKSCCRP